MYLKKSIIKLHCDSEKHVKGKEKLNKEKQEQDIVKGLDLYDKEVHPVEETLTANQKVFRVKVVSTFLTAGVLLNKLEVFHDLLEENGYRLAGRRQLSDLIPFVLSEEKQRIKKEIEGKDVSVIFDGTSTLGKGSGCVYRHQATSMVEKAFR